jgi:tRNA nucleotidyltransferase/poly(A) polymerase
MKRIMMYESFVSGKSVEMKLPQDVLDIANAYKNAGKDIYVVGGAVRDFIKGVEPKDYDLVTNALPDESKSILKGFRVSDEQGKNFGVLRVYTETEPEGYEIASYRRDISKGRDTKGEDQKVELGPDVTIKDDCMRRDLTMNALFYDIVNKKIVDLVGGIDDIKNGIVRAVGDPSQRFIEDRLRILRIFRFAARSGGRIDEKTAKSIKKDNRLKGMGPTDDVSQERVWEEMVKAWKQVKDYGQYLSLLFEFDMWEQVFPGVNITEPVDSEDFVVVIASLFANNPSTYLDKKLVQDYKIETSLAKKVEFLISLREFSAENILDYWRKRQSSGISDQTILEWLTKTAVEREDVIRFVDWKPTVKSEELIQRGFNGKALGDEIKRLEIEKFKSV